MRWTVLIPMRALPNAKSRLAATLPPQLHADVVVAIRADTLTAVRGVPSVARVVVVGDRAGDGVDVVQHSTGLNGALRDGVDHARRQWPSDGVVALVGDLPALRPEELGAALEAAGSHPSAFVADSIGTGTTLLTALPGIVLDPEFGPGSALRHAAHAVGLGAGPGLRHDVDTEADLAAAVPLGLGRATSAVLGINTLAPRSP